MQNGLPVLANINKGNDLAKIIRDEAVGMVCESNDLDEFQQQAESLLDEMEQDRTISNRCQQLFQREFGVERAVTQITAALRGHDGFAAADD